MENKNKKRQGFIWNLENELQHVESGGGVSDKAVFRNGVIAICFVADAVALFTGMDKYLLQMVVMSIVTVAVCAAILEGIPVILAKYVSQLFPANKVIKVILISCLCAIVTMVLLVGSLRWFSRHDDSSANAENMITVVSPDGSAVDTADTNADEENKDADAAESTLALLLAVLPLMTSIVCFAISYQDPAKARENLLRRQQIELEEEVKKLKTMCFEIDYELENRKLMTLDDIRFRNAKAENALIAEYAKIVARRCLCQRLNSPEATRLLMEENTLSQSIRREVFALEDKERERRDEESPEISVRAA